jgi:Uma2 family endonuclease
MVQQRHCLASELAPEGSPMTFAPLARQRPPTPHARFTVEQFHRLCEAVPEQRLELVDGEVLQVIAKGTRHAFVVNRLARAITLLLASSNDASVELRVEAPLLLDETNEPEPDLALVWDGDDTYLNAHPTGADSWLVIEVADTSLRYDLDIKFRLYADAGIPNYWVVDVQEPCLFLLQQQLTADPLLTALRAEVDMVLAAIPPA